MSSSSSSPSPSSGAHAPVTSFASLAQMLAGSVPAVPAPAPMAPLVDLTVDSDSDVAPVQITPPRSPSCSSVCLGEFGNGADAGLSDSGASAQAAPLPPVVDLSGPELPNPRSTSIIVIDDSQDVDDDADDDDDEPMLGASSSSMVNLSSSSSSSSSSAPPQPSISRAEADASELRLFQRFNASLPSFRGGNVTVALSLATASLLLDSAEMLRAWGLHSAFLVVRVTLPVQYLSADTPLSRDNTKVEIFQSNSSHGAIPTLERFDFAWPLSRLIYDNFLPTAQHVVKSTPLPRAYGSVERVEHVAQVAGVAPSDALGALKASNGDVRRATETLNRPVPELSSIREATGARAATVRAALTCNPDDPSNVLLLLNDPSVRSNYCTLAHHAISGRAISTRVTSMANTFNTALDVAKAAVEIADSYDAAEGLLAVDDVRNRLREQAQNQRPALQSMVDAEDRALQTEFERHNVLLQLMIFVERAMKRLHRQCLMCGLDLPHYGLRPSLCSSDQCRALEATLDSQGEGIFNLSSTVKSSPDVVDLLISLAYVAARAKNMPALAANPSLVSAVGPNDVILSFASANGSGTLDYGKVLACLGRCPPVHQLAVWALDGTLPFQLERLDPLLRPFLRWLLISNKCHLRSLDGNEFPDLGTLGRFTLLCAAPEREAEFQRLRCEARRKYGSRSPHGSTWAFHGSATRNWHSILRSGLKNMSGTTGQRHGAAFGPGIYFAVNLALALAYSRTVGGWPRSSLGPSLQIVSLCELVDDVRLDDTAPMYRETSSVQRVSPNLLSTPPVLPEHAQYQAPPQDRPISIYVVPDERIVVTRFLLVFPAGTNLNVHASGIEPYVPRLVTTAGSSAEAQRRQAQVGQQQQLARGAFARPLPPPPVPPRVGQFGRMLYQALDRLQAQLLKGGTNNNKKHKRS